MPGDRLMLLDTASLYFRAFYGVPQSMTSPDGLPVNAVRGMLDFVATLVTRYSPSHLVAAWDDDWRPAWRVTLLPSYKTHRVEVVHSEDVDVEQTPDGLDAQVPVIRASLEALGIAVVGAPECEADDVIGTLATTASMPVDVVTGDRDLFQLVDDSRDVRILYTARGVGRLEVYDEAAVTRKYGIPGRAYADFATLRGDPSDGMPGVAGVGEKTAASLVTKHGDLDGVIAAAADEPDPTGKPGKSGKPGRTGRTGMAPGLQAKIRNAADYLAAAREVVQVRTDVDLPDTDTTVPSAPAQPTTWAELVSRWGLGGSADRVVAALADES